MGRKGSRLRLENAKPRRSENSQILSFGKKSYLVVAESRREKLLLIKREDSSIIIIEASELL